MPLFNLVPRVTYHKNGTQFFGKMVARIIGEKNYEFVRLEKRITYARYWYNKQKIIFQLAHQYPNIAQWFSILNKNDTSIGFPGRRVYERHGDFAIFNVNSEGWFQLYFFVAAGVVLLWNYWMLAVHYDVRG
jgi:hypothetical protein